MFTGAAVSPIPPPRCFLLFLRLPLRLFFLFLRLPLRRPVLFLRLFFLFFLFLRVLRPAPTCDPYVPLNASAPLIAS